MCNEWADKDIFTTPIQKQSEKEEVNIRVWDFKNIILLANQWVSIPIEDFDVLILLEKIMIFYDKKCNW